MSRSSQKPTNEKQAISKAVRVALMPKTEAQVVRSAQTGRFIGMSHSIARVDAVIIPGYRIRG